MCVEVPKEEGEGEVIQPVIEEVLEGVSVLVDCMVDVDDPHENLIMFHDVKVDRGWS